MIILVSGNFFQPDIKLEGTELTSYEGTELSSINDFRENSIKGYQYISKEDYKLKITGLVNNPQNFTYDQITNNFTSYKKVSTLPCVEGWEVDILWQGVQIKDILKNAEIDENATTIIFHAYDRYTTSFSIGYILNNNIILAYKMNNVTIPPERGFPFQLVAESKWGYKWIKWVTEIELSDNPHYRGYWESRGYSNDGDINKGFFE